MYNIVYLHYLLYMNQTDHRNNRKSQSNYGYGGYPLNDSDSERSTQYDPYEGNYKHLIPDNEYKQDCPNKDQQNNNLLTALNRQSHNPVSGNQHFERNGIRAMPAPTLTINNHGNTLIIRYGNHEITFCNGKLQKLSVGINN